jgi:hypothetical protein
MLVKKSPILGGMKFGLSTTHGTKLSGLSATQVALNLSSQWSAGPGSGVTRKEMMRNTRQMLICSSNRLPTITMKRGRCGFCLKTAIDTISTSAGAKMPAKTRTSEIDAAVPLFQDGEKESATQISLFMPSIRST